MDQAINAASNLVSAFFNLIGQPNAVGILLRGVVVIFAFLCVWLFARLLVWRYNRKHAAVTVNLDPSGTIQVVRLQSIGLNAGSLRFGFGAISQDLPVLVSAYDEKRRRLGRTLRMQVLRKNSVQPNDVELSENDLRSLGVTPVRSEQQSSDTEAWPAQIRVRIRNVSQYTLLNLWNYPDPATQVSVRVGIVSGFVFAIVSYFFARLMDALLRLA